MKSRLKGDRHGFRLGKQEDSTVIGRFTVRVGLTGHILRSMFDSPVLLQRKGSVTLLIEWFSVYHKFLRG